MASRFGVPSTGTATRAMRVDPPTHLGEHPHRVLGLDLGHVEDLVAIEHREVGAFPDRVHESRQERAGPDAEQVARALAEPDQPRAEGVPDRSLGLSVPPTAPTRGAWRPAKRGASFRIAEV